MVEQRHYLCGFGNEHQSEVLIGALPVGRFSPQRPPYGLYAEQLSTTAFTVPRAANRRVWFYRLRPSVVQGPAEPIEAGALATAAGGSDPIPPNPLRWSPLPEPGRPVDFPSSLVTMAVNGNARMRTGIAVHQYLINESMTDRFFSNADGELLLVPQQGVLDLRTECGGLDAGPGEIAVIPRGMKFQIRVVAGELTRGYVCENYGAPFTLPERGPVGANGFANDRDFEFPVAAFDDLEGEFELITKFAGGLYRARLGHSPLDVVAWTGNSAPYRYALRRFNVINTVSFDHPDPSIFTVLTSASDTPGVANADFVIFPPRWMVAEDTFRPPWFHRNVMSEFMGLIRGQYDAKGEGFVPGGASLHNCMTPHGPDAEVAAAASQAALEPVHTGDGLAFMFESGYMLAPTPFALDSPALQADYQACWQGIAKRFDPARP